MQILSEPDLDENYRISFSDNKINFAGPALVVPGYQFHALAAEILQRQSFGGQAEMSALSWKSLHLFVPEILALTVQLHSCRLTIEGQLPQHFQ